MICCMPLHSIFAKLSTWKCSFFFWPTMYDWLHHWAQTSYHFSINLSWYFSACNRLAFRCDHANLTIPGQCYCGIRHIFHPLSCNCADKIATNCWVMLVWCSLQDGRLPFWRRQVPVYCCSFISVLFLVSLLTVHYSLLVFVFYLKLSTYM